MSEFAISDIFDRDLREIPLPSAEEWLPRTFRARRRLSWRTIALAAAVIAALILGAQIARLGGEPRSEVADPPARPGVLSRLTISGTVRATTNGQPLAGVTVFVLRDERPTGTQDLHIIGNQYTVKWSLAARTTTAANGTYSVQTGIGRYRVLFSSATSFASSGTTEPYEPLWWPAATNDDAATVIILEGDRRGLDAALRPGHLITGTTKNTATGLGRDGTIYAYLAGAQQCCAIVHATNVAADGTFRLPVPDGIYRLQYVTGMPFPFDTWLAGASAFADARDVVVTGGDVIGIEIPYD